MRTEDTKRGKTKRVSEQTTNGGIFSELLAIYRPLISREKLGFIFVFLIDAENFWEIENSLDEMRKLDHRIEENN